jgi:sugar-specific transcriptional regulator TrmB
MDVQGILADIGFRDIESRVYISLLELGESTVLPIAKKSGLQRTYCYDVLQRLVDRGIASYFVKNGRRRYVAEDPIAIERLYKERGQRLSAVVPELRSLYARAPGRPKVRFYEGREGLLSIYEELARTRSYCAISSPDHIAAALGKYFLELARRLAENGAHGRELITKHAKDIPYLKHFDTEHQEFRLLPEGMRLETDMVIFNDKLALISYGRDIHAITIESQAIVSAQLAMFNLLWKAAKPIRP